MELWQILILAVVQGIAEFLPISSSGHLVIVAALTGVSDNIIEVNIVLHVGTLFSILVFYWRRILRLLGEDRRVILLLAVGTLPAVVIGLTIKKLFPEVLESPLLAGHMLVVTGLLLLWATRQSGDSSAASSQEKEPPVDPSEKDETDDQQYSSLSFSAATLIGLAQAFAVLPGVSRSGSTISAGLKLGLSARSAATFSFLLAIPVIGGAGLLEVKDLLEQQQNGVAGVDVRLLAVGALVSFVVGLASLWFLVKMLERGRLSLFAWWCIPVGIAVVVWQLTAAPREAEPTGAAPPQAVLGSVDAVPVNRQL